MNMDKKLNITIKIADTEPIHFEIDREEESIYRKAEYHINKMWADFKGIQPGWDNTRILPRIALAFAELYYRKSEKLDMQKSMLDDFEKNLDEILLKTSPEGAS